MIGPSFPHVLVAAQRGDEQAFDMLWRDLHPAMPPWSASNPARTGLQ
jgi:hypothetical protein